MSKRRKPNSRRRSSPHRAAQRTSGAGTQRTASLPWDGPAAETLSTAPDEVRLCVARRRNLIEGFVRRLESFYRRHGEHPGMPDVLSASDPSAALDEAVANGALLDTVRYIRKEAGVFARLETQSERRGFQVTESTEGPPMLALMCSHSRCAAEGAAGVTVTLSRPSMASSMADIEHLLQGVA